MSVVPPSPPAPPSDPSDIAPPPHPHHPPRRRPRLFKWLVIVVCLVSLLGNLVQWGLSSLNLTPAGTLVETFASGKQGAATRIAVIQIHGTIMPPFTARTLKAIKQAKEDKTVNGILLEIDSPGGFVADSHQIYHRLRELSAEKPIAVSMGSMAASGGYYVAMGAGPKGRIFVEPTTWTGSIGVIIPRYELVGLKDKFGIDSKPLKTGEFKDALNPFAPLSDRERAVWDNILQQSLDRFVNVIDEGRDGLNEEQVRKLATGEIFTAQDALKHRLVDAVGYREDAIDALKQTLHAEEVEVFEYDFSAGLVDLLLGARAPDPATQVRNWLETTVPRSMYYCSWLPGLPRLSD